MEKNSSVSRRPTTARPCSGSTSLQQLPRQVNAFRAGRLPTVLVSIPSGHRPGQQSGGCGTQGDGHQRRCMRGSAL